MLLTPTKLVPKIWLDNISGSKVLYLASCGGQQGPVSNSFVNNIEKTWNEWYRILISGFANPIRYIFDYYEWEEHNNLVVKNSIPYSDIKQLPKAILDKFIRNNETLEFGHSLQSQIGWQIDNRLVIAGFYEDKYEGDILDNYIDTYIATKAIKLK